MSKFYFAPNTVQRYKTPYKLRNAKHLARWMVHTIIIFLSLALLSGVVRGCISSSAPAALKAEKKVTT